MKSHPLRHSPKYFADLREAFKPITRLGRHLSHLIYQARQTTPRRGGQTIQPFETSTTPGLGAGSESEISSGLDPAAAKRAEEDLQDHCEDLIESIEADIRLIAACRQQIESIEADIRLIAACTQQISAPDRAGEARDLAEKASAAMTRVKQQERDFEASVLNLASGSTANPARTDVVLQDLRYRAAHAFNAADRAWAG